MSTVGGVVSGLGVLLTVLCCLAALRPRTVYPRLHLLTGVSSLGGPLVGLGVIVADGFGLASATVLAIVVLLAVTGPVLSSAIGRLNAQADGVLEEESPE